MKSGPVRNIHSRTPCAVTELRLQGLRAPATTNTAEQIYGTNGRYKPKGTIECDVSIALQNSSSQSKFALTIKELEKQNAAGKADWVAAPPRVPFLPRRIINPMLDKTEALGSALHPHTHRPPTYHARLPLRGLVNLKITDPGERLR